jgi:hypothetical protein
MTTVTKVMAGLPEYSNKSDLFKDTEVDFEFSDVWVTDGYKNFEVDQDSVKLWLPEFTPASAASVPDEFELSYGVWYQDEQGVEPYFIFRFVIKVKERKPLPNGDVELDYDYEVLEATQEK